MTAPTIAFENRSALLGIGSCELRCNRRRFWYDDAMRHQIVGYLRDAAKFGKV
jgi:hypothetical protein